MIIKKLGLTDYSTTFLSMQDFTLNRTNNTEDEIWLTEHYSVFTQGKAGKSEHVLFNSDIPIVQSDRGGQITYHAPKQLITYFLIDIKRAKINIKYFVNLIEDTVIELLKDNSVIGYRKDGSPGIYVKKNNLEYKIASLGLRVKKGCVYHGVAINIDMDLSPFDLINPCGYSNLKMINLNGLLPKAKQKNVNIISDEFTTIISKHLLTDLNVSF